jgi:hypothetical protein
MCYYLYNEFSMYSFVARNMSKRCSVSLQVFYSICGVTVSIAATILSFGSLREVTGVLETMSLTYPTGRNQAA